MDDTANTPGNGYTRGQLLAAAAAGLFAFAVYFYSLPQVITGEDAGELTTAAYNLGIPHPPGYPTWCLLAHPFTWIPFGSVAWRVALSSAVFGALAVFVTGLIAARLTRSGLAALFAGVFLACTPSMYSQSIIADVYALNILLLTGTLLLALHWDETRDVRLLYLLALLFGLGQGVHNTAAIVAAITGVFVFLREPQIIRRPRVVLAALGIFLLGCATFLYLPIRSLANPVPDWGNPETLQAFLDHVLRKQFAFMYSQYPRTLASVGWQYWPFLLYVPPLLMAASQLRKVPPVRWAKWLLVGVVGLLPVAIIVWLQNPLPNLQWRMVMTPFWMPSAVLLALCIGNVVALGRPARLQRIVLYVVGGVGLVVFLGAYAPHYSKRSYTWVDEYARTLLEQLPQDAILFADADHLVFPVMYLQEVEGLRRDVTLGNPYGYVDVSLISKEQPELVLEIGNAPRRRDDPRFLAALLAHTTRPVYFSHRPRLPEGALFGFAQEGLLYRAVAKDTSNSVAARWPNYPWDDRYMAWKHHQRADYTARAVMAEYFLKRTDYLLGRGLPDDALQCADQVTMALRDEVAVLNNLANVLARRGKNAPAVALLEKALKLEPWNATLQENLEKVRQRRVQLDASDMSDKSDAELPTAE